MAGYREPGIYVKYQSSGAGLMGRAPYLIPTIVGAGPKYLRKTVAIVKGSTSNSVTTPVSPLKTTFSRTENATESTKWDVVIDANPLPSAAAGKYEWYFISNEFFHTIGEAVPAYVTSVGSEGNSHVLLHGTQDSTTVTIDKTVTTLYFVATKNNMIYDVHQFDTTQIDGALPGGNNPVPLETDVVPVKVAGINDFTILKAGKTSTSADYFSSSLIVNHEDYKRVNDLDPNNTLGLKRPAEDFTVSVGTDGYININWIASTTDFQIAADGSLETELAGTADGSDVYIRRNRKPNNTTTFYLDIIYPVNVDNNPNQFEPQLINLTEDINKYYGDVVAYADYNGATTEINRLALGLYLAKLNGTSLVYGLQVDYDATAKVKPDQFDYAKAIAKLQGMDSVYRIVPMDCDNAINSVVVNHVNQMSSPEERGERRAFLGCPSRSTGISDFSSLQKIVGNYASGLSNTRVGVISQYDVTVSLPNGDSVDLPGDLSSTALCAALAGLEGSLAIQKSMTKSSVVGFTKVADKINLLRTQKNMLAENGVILLEQAANENAPVVVRHALTTDMSTVEYRENSITTIKDYTGKLLRSTLDQFIGKENITYESLLRMKGAVESSLDTLIAGKILVTAEVNNVQQSTGQPDGVTIAVTMLPPYPCNIIDLTVVSG